MESVATNSHAADAFIGRPSPTGWATDGNGSASAESGSNIIQVTIGALMELCVQPQQAKVASSGGGGGNESGWGENNKERTSTNQER